VQRSISHILTNVLLVLLDIIVLMVQSQVNVLLHISVEVVKELQLLITMSLISTTILLVFWNIWMHEMVVNVLLDTIVTVEPLNHFHVKTQLFDWKCTEGVPLTVVLVLLDIFVMMVILFPHRVMQVIIVLLVPVISHALLVDTILNFQKISSMIVYFVLRVLFVMPVQFQIHNNGPVLLVIFVWQEQLYLSLVLLELIVILLVLLKRVIVLNVQVVTIVLEKLKCISAVQMVSIVLQAQSM